MHLYKYVQLHDIQESINDLSQYISRADQQTNFNIKERSNLLSMVERVLEKLENLSHCVSTPEKVGLEIEDVEQKINQYQVQFSRIHLYIYNNSQIFIC